MIIDFSFKNFRSFRDLTTLSMEAAYSNKNTTFEAEKYNLLKTAAIYGPNAGGKSTYLRLFLFLNFLFLNLLQGFKLMILFLLRNLSWIKFLNKNQLSLNFVFLLIIIIIDMGFQ